MLIYLFVFKPRRIPKGGNKSRIRPMTESAFGVKTGEAFMEGDFRESRIGGPGRGWLGENGRHTAPGGPDGRFFVLKEGLPAPAGRF